MIPYFIAMMLSVACSYWSSRIGQQKGLSVILSCFAICTPCVLAAFRDYGVGTDMRVYGEGLYQNALLIDDPIALLINSSIEPLFMLVSIVSAKVFGSREAYYFIIELLIIAPAYLGLRRLVSNRWLPYAWLLYWLVMFAYGFNLMRQCIAVSFAFFAFSFIADKRIIPFIVLTVISLGFHYTAIIGLCIPLLFLLLRYSKYSSIKACILFVATFLLVYLSPPIIELISGFKASYLYQYIHMVNYSAIDMVWELFTSAVFYAPLLLMVLVNHDKLAVIDEAFTFKVSVTFLALLVSLLSVVTSQAYRVALYFWSFLPWVIATLFCELDNINDRRIYSVVQVVFLVVFFTRFVMVGNGEIYPYTSITLGIV